MVEMVFSFLDSVSDPPSNVGHKRKSIAIVGGGSAGLAMLKTLLDLPERDAWNIVLFEERENVGGVWLPEPDPAPPPTIPKAPLYPALHTNIAAPLMAYPNFLYPAGTHLYPSHEHVESYLVSYAQHHGLLRYIRFNHQVLSTSWLGTPEAGIWNVTFSDDRNETRNEVFEHLIDATGNNRVPRTPSWPGQNEWLANTAGKHGRREIIHSAWYRHPETYANKSILIVGDSASGRDVATQTALLVSKVYMSARNTHQEIKDAVLGFLPPNVIRKPEISHFTCDSVVFIDDTEITDVNSIILATGYQIRKPFLEAGQVLVTDTMANSNDTKETLVGNTRYIFPLYKHIFSLSPMYPATALAFVGLPIGPTSCPSDIAQSMFIAYNIRDPSLLPSRRTMLHELALQEQALKAEGIDPYAVGHRIPNGSDYQDHLKDYLKQKGAIEDDGKKFVEEWRRKDVTYWYLHRGWKRIEELGAEDEWLKDISTVIQWSDLMDRVNKWQKDFEEGTMA